MAKKPKMVESLKVKCPKCGYVSTFNLGDEVVRCERCNYKMKVHYKLEKIKGDPVTYLLDRAKND